MNRTQFNEIQFNQSSSFILKCIKLLLSNTPNIKMVLKNIKNIKMVLKNIKNIKMVLGKC